MLYLYGITDARALPATPLLGLEGQPVALLPFNGIAAVTGELRQERPEANERNLREHFRVVEGLMADGTVLPVRFGTVFAGLAELQAHLAREHDLYASDLRRLRGQAELSVRAEWRETPPALAESEAGPAPADAGPGTRYLAGKRAMAAHNLAQERTSRELADRLRERLAAQATQVEWRALTAPSGVAAGVSMAFLLPGERLEAFQEAVAALRSSEPGLDILFTGPWPPYSFVSAPEPADALSGIF